MPDENLLSRVFDLWDRADRGEISASDLKKYKQIVEIFYRLSLSDESLAKADLIRARAFTEMEQSASLPAGKELKLVENA